MFLDYLSYSTPTLYSYFYFAGGSLITAAAPRQFPLTIILFDFSKVTPMSSSTEKRLMIKWSWITHECQETSPIVVVFIWDWGVKLIQSFVQLLFSHFLNLNFYCKMLLASVIDQFWNTNMGASIHMAHYSQLGSWEFLKRGRLWSRLN